MPIPTFRRLLRRARYGRPVIVVTGLPRSGTSMMMQMLRAGGVELLTDGRRVSDEGNPEGYYELERVKDLESDPDPVWLRGARGRAVKIIAFLLPHLPGDLNYKVLFMNRALDEVLASQARMLGRLGRETETEDARMRTLYVDHLARTRSLVTHRPCFEVLHLRYDEVVADALSRAREVDRFLGGGLDVDAMSEAVRPDLYRNRRS